MMQQTSMEAALPVMESNVPAEADFQPAKTPRETGMDWSVSLLDIEDQILVQEDGSLLNLSSLDWDSFSLYYDMDGNASLPESDLVSPGRVATLSVVGVLFLLAVLGHVLVIYRVARHPGRRPASYLHFSSMSLASLLYLLTCLPPNSLTYAQVDWVFGQTFCQADNYLASVCRCVQVWTLTLLGLSPVMARTARTTRYMVGIVWLVSTTVMIPRIQLFREVSVFHVTESITLCNRVASETTRMIDSALIFAGLYALPLTVLVVLYIRRNLGQRKKEEYVSQESYQEMDLGSHPAVTAVTALSFLAWLPYHLHNMVHDFQMSSQLWGDLVDPGSVVLLCSVAVHLLTPVGFVCVSRSCRRQVASLFRCTKSAVIRRKTVLGMSGTHLLAVEAPVYRQGNTCNIEDTLVSSDLVSSRIEDTLVSSNLVSNHIEDTLVSINLLWLVDDHNITQVRSDTS